MEKDSNGILDKMVIIGKSVYGFKVLSDFEPSPNMARSYNHGIAMECPSCESISTCVIPYHSDICEHDFCWYCKDCYIVWRQVLIGKAE